MSIKLTAEIRVLNVDGKDAEDGVSLSVWSDDGDETMLVFSDKENSKVIAVDKNELLEAVARVTGGEIRVAEKPKGDY